MNSARSHLHLLAGRLPVESGSHIEIMLTRTAATYLGNIKIGDTITLSASLLTQPAYFSSPDTVAYTQSVPVSVVGIFSADRTDAYWDNTDFEATPPEGGSPQPPYLGLTSTSVLFHYFDALAQQHGATGIFSDYIGKGGFDVYLAYQLATARLTSSDLDSVIGSLNQLGQDASTNFTSGWGGYNIQPPYINGLTLFGPTLSASDLRGIDANTLSKFRNSELAQYLPVFLLTAQIACLILFFISVMAGVLVERQQQAIAVMRSRGASRRQILGSLTFQGIGLCLAAGLFGPFCAFALVYLVAPHLLSATTADALNALTLRPEQTLSSLGNYTLLAVGVTILTIALALFLAVRANVLTQRREETRSTRRPLWYRLRLDLVIAMLALVSYSLSFSVESTSRELSAQAQSLVATPLELLSPLLLVFAGILFFLRFFPYLLRLLVRLTRQRSSLSTMLALTQMERSPRQAMRMALLLGLATAFAFFLLVFAASQTQRAQDLAAYQAGSDFSGYLLALPTNASNDPASAQIALTASYHQLQGVTSITVGYVKNVFVFIKSNNSAIALNTELRAVDAATFGATASWNAQNANTPLSDLMAQLVAQRRQALAHNVVPALVATSTWQELGLHPGSLFHLNDEQGNSTAIVYQALEEVAHIPPIDDSTSGAVLVDYPTLAAIDARNRNMLLPNYIWLRSSDDPAAVTHIRRALSSSGTLALNQLLDRRAMLASSIADPLVLNLLNILSIGVTAALLLALLANILLPALSVRMRLTHFAVLRALGTEPGQVTRILTWEQSIILITALVLGLCFGTILGLTAVPPLLFAGMSPSSALISSDTAIFALQRILPVTIIFPPSLGVALLALIATCLLALGLMTRLAQGPLMGQALRIDED
jgi:ABC-type antimicrobial peptide transport system permease subunit